MGENVCDRPVYLSYSDGSPTCLAAAAGELADPLSCGSAVGDNEGRRAASSITIVRVSPYRSAAGAATREGSVVCQGGRLDSNSATVGTADTKSGEEPVSLGSFVAAITISPRTCILLYHFVFPPSAPNSSSHSRGAT